MVASFLFHFRFPIRGKSEREAGKGEGVGGARGGEETEGVGRDRTSGRESGRREGGVEGVCRFPKLMLPQARSAWWLD